MTNKISNSNNLGSKKYDLLERTAKLGEGIIDFAKLIKKDEITRPLISQLIRAGTSIGANYTEADAGESKKDFKHKISISRKEAKETMHWLRMIARVNPDEQQSCRKLWKECQELVFIFSSIINKSQ
jgi:four helix bundle protein